MSNAPTRTPCNATEADGVSHGGTYIDDEGLIDYSDLDIDIDLDLDLDVDVCPAVETKTPINEVDSKPNHSTEAPIPTATNQIQPSSFSFNSETVRFLTSTRHQETQIRAHLANFSSELTIHVHLMISSVTHPNPPTPTVHIRDQLQSILQHHTRYTSAVAHLKEYESGHIKWWTNYRPKQDKKNPSMQAQVMEVLEYGQALYNGPRTATTDHESKSMSWGKPVLTRRNGKELDRYLKKVGKMTDIWARGDASREEVSNAW